MFIRALVAFCIFPVTFSGIIPSIIIVTGSRRSDGYPAALIISIIGLAILLKCVRDFYVTGKGTLAHWDPPKNMVTTGLYKYVRNPMYIGVISIVGGLSLTFGSPGLAIYLAVLWTGFHLHVVLREEPWLARQFPEKWAAYSKLVSRWLPKIPKDKSVSD